MGFKSSKTKQELPITNCLVEIRLKLAAFLGYEINKQEMAAILGLARSQYYKYENQEDQPGLLNALLIVRALKKYELFKNLYVDDIFKIAD